MATYYIKEDDTSPRLEVNLKNANDNPLDLNGASVDIRIAEARGGSNIVNREVAVTNSSNGEIEFEPQAGDFADDGRYRFEFEVTYTDGSVETFPNKGYHTVMVSRNMEV